MNHCNILQFIGILYREGKVLVLITGTAPPSLEGGGMSVFVFPMAARVCSWYGIFHASLQSQLYYSSLTSNCVIPFSEYADGGTLRRTIKNMVSS